MKIKDDKVKKFEEALMRFTLISIIIIAAAAFCAGVILAYSRVSGNITGESPVSAQTAVENMLAEFEKIVNF